MTEKESALARLEIRKKTQIKKIDNASLPAYSPMYFYCKLCGHLSDVKPESYLDTPRKLCKECDFLKEMGWLE